MVPNRAVHDVLAMATPYLDARQPASWKLEIYRTELLEMGELRHREPDRQCLAALDPTPALTRSHFPTYDGHPLGYGVGAFYLYQPSECPFRFGEVLLVPPQSRGHRCAASLQNLVVRTFSEPLSWAT